MIAPRLFAPLRARSLWAAASPTTQDAALDAVAQRLGDAYALLGATWVGERTRVRLGAFRHVATGMTLHLIPGDPSGEVEPCLVGRTPVTAGEWGAVHGFGRPPRSTPVDLPVTGVSWHGARAWLDAAGGGLRLPSEAEWEHACRAGARAPWWWGDAFDPARCWHRENAGGRPHTVDGHAARANGYGLIDTLGNVGEWCLDDLDLPMEGSAWQEHDPGKTVRGGGYDATQRGCQVDARRGVPADTASPDVGFRAFRAV